MLRFSVIRSAGSSPIDSPRAVTKPTPESDSIIAHCGISNAQQKALGRNFVRGLKLQNSIGSALGCSPPAARIAPQPQQSKRAQYDRARLRYRHRPENDIVVVAAGTEVGDLERVRRAE